MLPSTVMSVDDCILAPTFCSFVFSQEMRKLKVKAASKYRTGVPCYTIIYSGRSCCQDSCVSLPHLQCSRVIVDCCDHETRTIEKFDNWIFDYRLTSLIYWFIPVDCLNQVRSVNRWRHFPLLPSIQPVIIRYSSSPFLPHAQQIKAILWWSSAVSVD